MEENKDNVKTPDAVVDKSGKEFKADRQHYGEKAGRIEKSCKISGKKFTLFLMKSNI